MWERFFLFGMRWKENRKSKNKKRNVVYFFAECVNNAVGWSSSSKSSVRFQRLHLHLANYANMLKVEWEFRWKICKQCILCINNTTEGNRLMLVGTCVRIQLPFANRKWIMNCHFKFVRTLHAAHIIDREFYDHRSVAVLCRCTVNTWPTKFIFIFIFFHLFILSFVYSARNIKHECFRSLSIKCERSKSVCPLTHFHVSLIFRRCMQHARSDIIALLDIATTNSVHKLIIIKSVKLLSL